jgi:hypothetical protein
LENNMKYEVVADRDKGDDIGAVYEMFKPGYRATYEVVDAAGNATLVRIERPVLTTDEPSVLQGVDMDAVYGIIDDIRNGEHLTWEDGWGESNAQMLESALRRMQQSKPGQSAEFRRGAEGGIRSAVAYFRDENGFSTIEEESAESLDRIEVKALRDTLAHEATLQHPSLPTREQIAALLYRAEYADVPNLDPWEAVREHGRTSYLAMADAVLTLLQNGADR